MQSPRTFRGGLVKPELLRILADVAEKYHGILKCTSAQRIMITNLNGEDIEQIWQEIGMEPAVGFANCVRSIKICPGTAFCKRGKQDSIRLGLELDRLYHKKEMPSRMKMGVAGCANSCSEIYIKDIGILGTDEGWIVYVGGTAGSHPRLGDELITNLNDEEVLQIVAVIVSYYQTNAGIERVGQFIERIGFEKFKTDVLARYDKQAGDLVKFPVSDIEQDGKIVPVAGGLTEGTLVLGDEITEASVISDIIRVYPQTVPILRSHGMGCLGCPSSTGEAIAQAADIHGIQLADLLIDLNKAIGK